MYFFQKQVTELLKIFKRKNRLNDAAFKFKFNSMKLAVKNKYFSEFAMLSIARPWN